MYAPTGRVQAAGHMIILTITWTAPPQAAREEQARARLASVAEESSSGDVGVPSDYVAYSTTATVP